MEENYKETFYYGLKFIVADLESYENTTFSSSIKYFSYPIYKIIEEIKKQESIGGDTNQFYKLKCDELQCIYNRLLMTVFITKEYIKPNKPSIKSKIKKYVDKLLVTNSNK